MSDEPSNAASDAILFVFAVFSAGSPAEGGVRAALTDDFVYADRRRVRTFPNADAESFTKLILSVWQTGAGGQPRFQTNTLALRGQRFAALAVRIDYGNGMLSESIHVIGLDDTVSLVQRDIQFDHDDLETAIAELDRLHRQAEAN